LLGVGRQHVNKASLEELEKFYGRLFPHLTLIIHYLSFQRKLYSHLTCQILFGGVEWLSASRISG
jgi:hypothetical protein